MNEKIPTTFDTLMKRNWELQNEILTLQDQMAYNEEILGSIKIHFDGLLDAIKKVND